MRKFVLVLMTCVLGIGLVACSSSSKKASSPNKTTQPKECAPLNDMAKTVAAIRKDPATAPAQAAKLKALAPVIAANPPAGYESEAKQFSTVLITTADKLTTPMDAAGAAAVLDPVFKTQVMQGDLLKLTYWAISNCHGT